MSDKNARLLEMLLLEIVSDLAHPPQVVNIPVREHELVMVKLFVRRDTLRMLNSLGATYGVRRSKIMRCMLNAMGKYLEQESQRSDINALLGDVRARIGGGPERPAEVPDGEKDQE